MADTVGSLLCLAGVWGFVVCIVLFILKGFPARDRFDRAGALGWGIGAVAGFVVWIIGMTRA